MARDMVWLSGLLLYEQAAAVFARIGQRMTPSVSVWRQTQRYGACLEAQTRRQQEQVSLERVVLPDRRTVGVGIKGVGMDGGMMNIRLEGWKEFKVGTIFDVENRLERDPRTGELVPGPHGVAHHYAATLGSVADFSPCLWALAAHHDVPHADESAVTADGAEWIWNLTADLFPDSLQVVDYYHACQHLAQAAAALFPNDPLSAQRWYTPSQEALFQGAVHLILAHLDLAGLPDHARYFRTHQRRMHDQEFREMGFPIGSGITESGIKQFKLRLTGPAMRWSRPAAQQMLLIRGAALDHSFDALWDAALPQN
jgi:hypothetical protein